MQARPEPESRPADIVAAGWNPDPTGRYALRWFDGDGWTAQVSDCCNVLTDWSTLPPYGRRRSLFSLFVSLIPGLILLVLVAFAIRG